MYPGEGKKQMFGFLRPKKDSSSRAKILVIDDEPDYVSTIQYRLKHSGYDVITAVNGKEGVEKTITERPELVLLDTSMPVMNGWEVLEQLRKHPDVAETPVIMVTARCEVHDIDKASAFGISDYVAKPFDYSELMKKISHALENRAVSSRS